MTPGRSLPAWPLGPGIAIGAGVGAAVGVATGELAESVAWGVGGGALVSGIAALLHRRGSR